MTNDIPPRTFGNLFTVLLLSIATAGCASVVRKPASWSKGGAPTQRVQVVSEPAGASVYLRGRFLGVTPTVVELSRRDARQILRIEKEGYRALDVAVKRRFSALLAGNLPLAGLAVMAGGSHGMDPPSTSEQIRWAIFAPGIGVGLDLLTGAGYALPSRVHVTLHTESPYERSVTAGCPPPGQCMEGGAAAGVQSKPSRRERPSCRC